VGIPRILGTLEPRHLRIGDESDQQKQATPPQVLHVLNLVILC